MAEREIICCGGRSWSKTIAWMQIVSAIIGALVELCLMSIDMGNEQYRYFRQSIYPTLYVLTISILLVDAAFGFMLLKGAQQDNITYLRRWVIYTSVWLFFSVNAFFIGLLSLNWLMAFIIPMAWYGYGIWVVRVFIAEIRSKRAGAGAGEASQSQGRAQGQGRLNQGKGEEDPSKYQAPPPYNTNFVMQQV